MEEEQRNQKAILQTILAKIGMTHTTNPQDLREPFDSPFPTTEVFDRYDAKLEDADYREKMVSFYLLQI